jgi:hypothetical protein
MYSGETEAQVLANGDDIRHPRQNFNHYGHDSNDQKQS